MRAPRRRLLALAVAAGLAAIALTPTAAQAAYYGDETDYAIYSLGPEGEPIGSYTCVTFTGAIACLKANGDRLYVKDTKADGYAAVAEWYWSFGTEPSRSGACVNKLTAGDWGLCNKNFMDDTTMSVRAARYNSGNLVDRGTWVGMRT